MPIYEFECKACSQVSEHIMKISDPAPASCPHCQKENSLRKLMSQTSFVLKGQGWYETDFKGSKPKSTSSSTTSSEDSSKKAESSPNKEEKKPSKASSSTTSKVS